jgi:hypothetical protein
MGRAANESANWPVGIPDCTAGGVVAMLLTDLLSLATNVRPQPIVKDVWIDKVVMTISFPADLAVSWKAKLVQSQVQAAAELLRGKLYKKANGLGTRTVLVYLDNEMQQYLTLDLASFILWLGQHFILKEHGTSIQWGYPNRCFAAKLYDAAVEDDSPVDWVKQKEGKP